MRGEVEIVKQRRGRKESGRVIRVKGCRSTQ
jgi:hypothetical protein